MIERTDVAQPDSIDFGAQCTDFEEGPGAPIKATDSQTRFAGSDHLQEEIIPFVVP